MIFDLNLKLFTSALEVRDISNLSEGNSHIIGLVIAGNETPLNVDVIEIVEKSASGTEGRVLCRIANDSVDYSSLNEGVDFFITEAGKMIGKGIVNRVRI